MRESAWETEEAGKNRQLKQQGMIRRCNQEEFPKAAQTRKAELARVDCIELCKKVEKVVCIIIAQYPVRRTAQSAVRFLPSVADLFIPAPTRLLREAF